MKRTLFFVVCLVSIISVIVIWWLDSVGQRPPHILLIVADDYGYNDIGYHGSEIYTPNLDRLAYGGVRLENYYVQPICTPTRVQLLSGRYQIHTGLQHSIIGKTQPNALPLTSPTIADRLKEAGYSTHMVGKWHVGFYKKEFTPLHRGFHNFFGYLTGDEDYFSHKSCYNGKCAYDLRENEDPANMSKYENYYSTHLFANKVIDIINNHTDDKPLFIYLPFQAVHGPQQVPTHYEERYKYMTDKKRRIYAGMVTCMDEAVGNITLAMQKKGLWDNTVLILTTDNGGQPKNGGNNWPLRGKKSSLWEGAIRAVGFVHSALLNNKVIGNISSELMHVTDWLPTLVHLAGGSINDTYRLDGFNQWNTLRYGSSSSRTELLHNIDPLFKQNGKKLYNGTFNNSITAALRIGPWKIITGHAGDSHWYRPTTYRTQPLRIIEKHPTTDSEKNIWLFNIKDDPSETNDMSSIRPDIVRSMLDRLQFYNSTMVPCNFPPGDKNAIPKSKYAFWGPWQ